MVFIRVIKDKTFSSLCLSFSLSIRFLVLCHFSLYCESHRRFDYLFIRVTLTSPFLHPSPIFPFLSLSSSNTFTISSSVYSVYSSPSLTLSSFFTFFSTVSLSCPLISH
uniref:Uncharacterized protein n=1 Tax=Cacopsylla melanoneura TaxID=428564 RepID=A0A8D9BWE1_9HEMI